MQVSAEIKAAQEAYAARPWFVMWRDSHCQVPCRFHTFEDAFEYVQDQWRRIKATVARERYSASNLGWRGENGSWIEGPDCKMPLGWLLLAKDVSSY